MDRSSSRERSLVVAHEVALRIQGIYGPDVHAALVSTLGYVCDSIGIDALGVRWLGSDRIGIPRVHAYTRSKFAWPPPFVLKRFPWSSSTLAAGGTICLGSLGDLPDEAERTRQHLERLGVRAYVGIRLPPFANTTGYLHAAITDPSRTETWSAEDLEVLRLVGILFVGALQASNTIVALRESERRYRGIVEDQTGCIVRWQPGGIRTFVNEAYCRAFGARREDLLGTSFFPLIQPEDRARVIERIEALTPDYPCSTSEHRTLLPDGTVQWQRWTDRACFDARGELIEVQSAGQDITSERETRFELEEAVDQLTELKARLQRENRVLEQGSPHPRELVPLIGSSPALLRCVALVEQAAPTPIPVLISGETGTGKELFARAVHFESGVDGPLISVNCAALAAQLIESELFGHERGAFTGAHTRRIGRLELAKGGSLFLDEIGDLPIELQPKLLRVLQERRFERIGDTRTTAFDARVIAATNTDLEAAVAAGTFREDLYYRLHVFPIDVPPLRERIEDIPALVNHFVQKHGESLGRRIERISEEWLAELARSDWPGNIRQLEHTVQRALISGSGPVLQPTDTARRGMHPEPQVDGERQRLLEALESTGWVIEGEPGAARLLGLRPSTLRSRLSRLGIRRNRTRSDEGGV